MMCGYTRPVEAGPGATARASRSLLTLPDVSIASARARSTFVPVAYSFEKSRGGGGAERV